MSLSQIHWPTVVVSVAILAALVLVAHLLFTARKGSR